MPLTAEDIKKLMPSLEAFLAMKAAEGLDMETGEEKPEASATPDTAPTEGGEGSGMGVVIAMKPKLAGGGEKVAGCPDCADGTPHEHVK